MPHQILIVDDEEDIARLLELIILSIGQITLAYDGKQAYDLINRHSNQFDLGIIDYCMPNMNGLELFQKLEPGKKPKQSLLCTCLTDPRILAEAREAGFTGVITKPFDNGALYRIVQDLLTNHQQSDEPTPPNLDNLLIA